MSRQITGHLLLAMVAVLWGATFVLIKSALQDISPLYFNTVRMVFSAAVLGLIFWKEAREIRRPALIAGAAVGLFLAGGYQFQTVGLVHTTAAKSGLITGYSNVLVPVFLVLFWRSSVNGWTWLGVVAASAGLWMLSAPSGSAGHLLEHVNIGDILTLGCAMCFAMQIILLGRATARHPFTQMAFLQTATAAMLMTVSLPILEAPQAVWSAKVLTALLITGLFGTALAFTIQAWAQQFTPPTHAAIIFLIEPVAAWITSYLVLGENLGLRAAFGAVLILSGVLLSELKGGATPAAA